MGPSVGADLHTVHGPAQPHDVVSDRDLDHELVLGTQHGALATVAVPPDESAHSRAGLVPLAGGDPRCVEVEAVPHRVEVGDQRVGVDVGSDRIDDLGGDDVQGQPETLCRAGALVALDLTGEKPAKRAPGDAVDRAAGQCQWLPHGPHRFVGTGDVERAPPPVGVGGRNVVDQPGEADGGLRTHRIGGSGLGQDAQLGHDATQRCRATGSTERFGLREAERA